MEKDDYLIVVSIGNAEKANITEKLLRQYSGSHNIVIDSDSETGRRIGSGGFTLKAIKQYLQKHERIAIILSGGLSKRSVGYSFVGKAFSDVRISGEDTLLIEPILQTVEKIMSGVENGVLLYCADILFEPFNPAALRGKNIGFAAYDSIEVGKNHGVMFPDKDKRLDKYVHKGGRALLEKLANQSGLSLIPVDTGTVFLNYETAENLFNIEKELDIVNTLTERNEELSLYEDIISPMANESHICNPPDGQSLFTGKIKEQLFKTMHGKGLYIDVSEKGFFHFGTTEDYIRNIFRLTAPDSNVIISSEVGEDCRVGEKTVICYSEIGGSSVIGNNCVINGFVGENVVIPDNTSVCSVRLNDKTYVTVVSKISSDFKGRINGVAEWDSPMFYRDSSICGSYKKFISGADEEKVSLSFCSENADYDYFLELKKTDG